MKKGTYQRKLERIFITIALSFVFTFSVLVGGFYLNTSISEHNFDNYTLFSSFENTTNISLQAINNSITSISSSESSENYADATVSSHEIFYSVRLLETLQKTVSTLDSIEYTIYITKLDNTSFVLTPSQTMSKEMFFSSSYSNIDYGTWLSVQSHFENSNQSLFFANYSNNELKSIFYISKYEYDNSSLLYFAEIPYSIFSGTLAGTEFTLLNYDLQPFAFSDIGIADLDYDSILSNTQTAFYDKIYTNDYYIVSNTLPLGITLVYFPESFSIDPVPLAIFIAALIVCSFIFFLIFRRLTINLYRPIKKVLENIETDDGFDEFKSISTNVSKLSSEITSITGERNTYIKNRYYRELLYGLPDMDCPLNAAEMLSDYIVMLVSFDSSATDDISLHLQKNYLYLFTREIDEPVYYVNDNINISALIFKDCSADEVLSYARKIKNYENITLDTVISISDTFSQVMYICDAYIQASSLLSKAHLFEHPGIITSKSQKISNASYFFPVSTANRLVKSIVSARPEALDIFDAIIRKNSDISSGDDYRNFIFSLANIIHMTIYELGSTPLELIGEDIDFDYLYSHWKNKETLGTIRGYIVRIIEGLSKKSELEDTSNELLLPMKEYIYQNYNKDILLSDVAEHFHITPTYCSAIFKKMSSENFKTFLNSYRITKACEMLKENPNIKIVDLSTMTGFNSSNSFIRVFKNNTGTTPKEYIKTFNM